MAAAHQEYPITKFQPVYYAADSFADAREKMAEVHPPPPCTSLFLKRTRDQPPTI